MPDLIVLGGGPAGVTAALRARELGASVALVERGRLGGTCTNDGCAPTRVLAKAARLVREAQQFGDYGLVGVPPTVDLPRLLARAQQTVYRLHEKKQLIGHLHQSGVSVWANAGEAHFVDAHTLVLADGTRLQGEKFILCVGGHARRLSFPGAEFARTHSDVWTLARLPRALAVVGGAATGCQLASVFAAFGTHVTLLDVAPRLLPAEDESVADELARAFRARGIDIITGIGGITEINQAAGGGERTARDLTPQPPSLKGKGEPEQALEGMGGQRDSAYPSPLPFREGGGVGEGVRSPAPGPLRLHYTLDGPQELSVDCVIMAVGWAGNVEGLDLAAADVQTARGYVVVDDGLRTTAPHIYAAGDITGRMMLVQSAEHEATLAAENAVLGHARTHTHGIVPHGGFTDPEHASVGLTESQARAAGHAYAAARVPYADMDRAVIDGQTAGFCKLIVGRDSHAILGAHVVGEQAVEIVQLVAAGMAAGLRVEQLAELELAYPTFTGIVGLAARQLARELGLTPQALEWRTLRPLSARDAEWERREEET